MVVWYVGANHWGGYSYRLCKMPDKGRKYLTEECFQQIPIKFQGNEVSKFIHNIAIKHYSCFEKIENVTKID